MSICVFRDHSDNATNTSERWIFSYGEGIEKWYIRYDKIVCSNKGLLIAVESNFPWQEKKYDSATYTEIKSAPLPDDVRAEFFRKRAEMFAQMLSAPIKL